MAPPLDLLHVNGDVRIGTCVYEADGGISCVSDARFKHGVQPLPGVLDRVAALAPVSFSWRADAFPDRGFGAHESTGLIAQDVERVLPELVTTDVQGYKTVNYGKTAAAGDPGDQRTEGEERRARAPSGRDRSGDHPALTARIGSRAPRPAEVAVTQQHWAGGSEAVSPHRVPGSAAPRRFSSPSQPRYPLCA